ncbi:MBL fold metallo-hydrolase [Donghicola mangrovi]|uniref:MBL fold metallo-hydrolase n=1 Tax=Donghicola mangrovi TaxID=2729614 RepID=A0A850Q6S1_9RHOB|nr:MBL fold metallo-hydrolase [Donghicola mangrovi]NVO24826.1 MBL fold metallo-hydrolase [Donghicola mangrovi]
MSHFKPSRRELLKLSAMAPAFALPASTAPAMITAPAGDNPSHFRFGLGDAQITVISDGFLVTPASGLGVNADPAEVQAFLAAHYLPTDTSLSHTNHIVIDIGEARVLVDVGSGDRFLQTAGRLMTNLESAGIDPATITHVIITHAHPDHIWGIRDEFDEAILPDAQYFIGAAEHDFWLQDGLAASSPTEMQQFVVGAVNSLNVEGADWTLVQDGQEICPGVTMIATPGHTPGHMSVHVESGGQQMIALGDSMSHAYTNFAHPDWFNGFDMDGAQTVATRQTLLDRAAEDRITVVGYHFPFPGVGHVLREGGTYRFLPALWKFKG